MGFSTGGFLAHQNPMAGIGDTRVGEHIWDMVPAQAYWVSPSSLPETRDYHPGQSHSQCKGPKLNVILTYLGAERAS